MATNDKAWDETATQRSDEDLEPNEAKFVFELWDSLARQNPEAYELILSRNPKLRENYGNLRNIFADLREAFVEGPDLVRREYPKVMAKVDSHFQEGTLTRMFRKLDGEELREVYELIVHKLVTQVLELIGGTIPVEARMKARLHLCHQTVLARFKTTAEKEESVRDALIDELATVLERPDVSVMVNRDDLQRILDHEDVVDEYYRLEACVAQMLPAA